MTHVVTYVDVQPSSTNQAISLLKQYRGDNPAELLQEIFRPNRFVLIEDRQASETSVNLQAIQNSPNDQRIHQPFAVAVERKTTTPDAFHVVTHVDVPPPRREETEALLQSLAAESRNDAGNLRFDVFQQIAPRTNHFTVVAIWTGRNTFDEHEAAQHTRRFREALGPMLGAPYDERFFKSLA